MRRPRRDEPRRQEDTRVLTELLVLTEEPGMAGLALRLVLFKLLVQALVLQLVAPQQLLLLTNLLLHSLQLLGGDALTQQGRRPGVPRTGLRRDTQGTDRRMDRHSKVERRG